MQLTAIFAVYCIFDPGTKTKLSGPGTKSEFEKNQDVDFYFFLRYLSGVPNTGYSGIGIFI